MLPQISSLDPVTKPAQQEQAFDSLYIVGLGFADDGAGNAQLNVAFKPYDYATKTLDPTGAQKTVSVPDVWTEVQTVPALAQAMGVVIQVSALLYQRDTLAAKISAEGADPADVATWQTQLDAVKQSLGMEV